MKRILVTGSRGMLGSLLVEELEGKCLGADLPEADVTHRSKMFSLVREYRPDVIINAAAITDVDFCQTNPHKAMAVHHDGVRILTETGVRLVTLSTDHVFTDGRGEPVTESRPVDPVNVYAETKLLGEKAALENPVNCVVRISWLVGERGMLPWMAARLGRGETLPAVADQTGCITLAEDLVKVLLQMAFDETRSGLYHCVNPGPVTPFGLACTISRRMGTGRVVPVEWRELSLPARRPLWSALGTERDIAMPPYEEAMEICLKKIL